MGSSEPMPVQLYQAGFRELVSVIPPGAPLSPSSRVNASQLGKTPGIKYSSGTWGGYGWLKHDPTEEDVRQWVRDGANIGIRGTLFPGLDIDCLDPWISSELTQLALRHFGPAPQRTGRAPKVLLMYRTAEPFARMAALLKDGSKTHLVEVLGQGRQYLIYGTHPSGVQYGWDRDISTLHPDQLTYITREQVEEFFSLVSDHFGVIGYEVERIGDGRLRSEKAANQDGLKAPSMEILEECVAFIPNDADTDRETYVKIGYAIKAAAQDDEDAGFRIFSDWSAKHDGSDRVEGNPETWRADWRRMRPPYAVGWTWLSELARKYGYCDAENEFEAQEARIEEVRGEEYEPYSDQWLANRVILDIGQSVRYSPLLGKWFVWNGGVWGPDELGLAQHLVGASLRRLSPIPGGSDKEQAKAQAIAMRMQSAGTRSAVLSLVQTDVRITVKPSVFDTDPLILNTPGGIVDLRTGIVRPHDPEQLCSKMTVVAPDPTTPAPMWKEFLKQITLGDERVENYLQRLAGYSLTGLTSEQKLFFLWGPGGNGKGVWLNTLVDLMGPYAATAPMDTFTATVGDRHPTDLASLMGARLVGASETQGNRRWDEARVKNLTGGDPISARFMRQDFFTFKPQFTLICIGNHKPEIRDLDKAMRRRIYLLNMTYDPPKIVLGLADRLKSEWPAILSWAIEGCRKWLESGLQPPPALQEATQEYFADQDPIGRWMDEGVEMDPEAIATTQELFDSWRSWANHNGEYAGNTRRFAQLLVQRRFERVRDVKTRRKGFKGLRVRPHEFVD